MHPHKLPTDLTALIESSFWPSVESNRQELEPLLGETAAHKLSPDDDRIVLMVPPFHTIADEVRGGNELWTRDLTNVARLITKTL